MVKFLPLRLQTSHPLPRFATTPKDPTMRNHTPFILGVGAVLACALARPSPAAAWGYEGHRIVAAIARAYLTPAVLAKVDALLAADTDTLEAHDMMSAATWADTYRASHRETAAWHFVDIELDHPDVKAACFGDPAPAKPASAGPAQDCLINRTNAFAAELADPATPQAERIVALKFVLHFVGDLHQPLHAADNQDRGANCVRLALGGARTTNLHSFWDTGLVNDLGPDPVAVAATLRAQITPADKTRWERADATTSQPGDPMSWARESYQVAKRSVYVIGAPAGCDASAAPLALPAGYEAASQAVVADQLKKAGVRLAQLLNRTLGGLKTGA
jgi:hypothetical protein